MKQKILTTLLCWGFIFSLGILNLPAQKVDTLQLREVGIRNRMLFNNEIGIVFKNSTKRNHFRRYGVNFNNMYLNSGNSNYGSRGNIHFNLFRGIEKRKQLFEKFYFIRGLGFHLGMQSYWTDSNNSSQNFTRLFIGAHYVLGLQYNLSNFLYVNMEAVPGLNISNHIQNNGNIQSIDFQIGAAYMSLVYVFNRKK